MDEVIQPVITIPKSTDSRLGYLNNTNTFAPFTLENKKWPTVEHYVLAKRFEGTVLEEEIRKSKNTYTAKMLTIPKNVFVEENGRVYRKIAYGTKEYICEALSVKEWEKIRPLCIENAIRAKFSQNKRFLAKLTRTEGMKIIDENDENNTTGKILEKIRDEELNKHGEKKERKTRKFNAPYADVKGGLSEDELLFVKNFIATIGTLKEVEAISSQTPTTPEMLEDVFYNFYRPEMAIGESYFEEATEILNISKLWIAEHSLRWTEVTKNMPNYEKIVRGIESLFRETLKTKGKDAFTIKNAILLATIIRWLRMDSTKLEKKLFLGRHVINKDDYIIPPFRRDYRVTPNLLFLEKSTTRKRKEKKKPEDAEKKISRGALYIELFKKKEKISSSDFSVLVGKLEEMKRKDRKSWLLNFESWDSEKRKEEIKKIVG